MSVYQLKTFIDIVNSIREELGVQSTDTTAMNRIRRVVNIIYAEVVSKKKWYWLDGRKDLTLPAYTVAGTVTVTQNSADVTLTIAPGSSKVGYYFALDGYSEIYTIESHSANSTSLKLGNVYTGSTISGASYKIWTDKLALPIDCKETVEVAHDFYRQPMDNVGRQEFNRVKRLSPRNEAKPMAYFTGDYVDPAQTSTIASLPSISTRSSALMRKTIVFSAGLPTAVVTAITAGDPVRWRVSSAGHPSYNGDIFVSTVSTTSVANDSITYTGVMEYTESATADSSMTISSLDQEQDYDRYRELFVYPSLTNAPITLHVDYVKEALPLNSDSDEPVIPIHDRIILRYGALSILWPSIGRNPEEGARNKGLYDEKCNQMESKWQDSTDNAILRPSKNYLGSKRNILRKRSIDLDSGPLIAGGSAGAPVITGTANSAAQFGTDGALVGSPTVSTTELGYLDGVTSAIQTQLNAKQSATLTSAHILVGNVSNVATDVVVSGDVSITNTGATTVTTVGGSTAANINTAEVAANAATNVNTVSTIVKRDGSGNFSAGTITAALTGNVTGNLTGNASTVTTNANLTGDVTSVGNATTIGATKVTNSMLAGSIAASKLVGSDIATVGTVTSGTWSASTIALNKGGTGQTTKAPAFDALQPMSTLGDIIYGGASGTGTRLAGNTTAIKQFLSQQGNGSVSAAPVWSTVSFTSPTQTRLTSTGTTTGWLFTISTSTTCAVGDTYTNNSNTYTVLGALSAQSGQVLFMSGASAPTASGTLTRSSGAGTSSVTFSAATPLATYTTASGALYLRARMVGGGGGGGAGTSQTTAGGTGGITTFGPNLLIANGGGGGTTGNSANGIGGTASVSSPAYGTALTGASTTGCSNTTQTPGTAGAASPFGGAGSGGNGGGGAGASGAGNTGSGGGGGGTGASGTPGAGGSAGGFVDALIPSSLSATYSYCVGASGSAGTGGVGAGPGGSGYIEITEYYQ